MKKVAILFSGQIRENTLGYNENACDDILNSYSAHFITDKFKEHCDYDIFIETDNINIEKTLDFFGKDKVKNIHCENTGYYIQPVESKIQSIEFYMDRYYKLTNEGFTRFPQTIHQYHRIARCFEVLENYKNPDEYDYIIRSRLDTVYENNIMDYIEHLNNNDKCQIMAYDDQFAVGRPKIMRVYLDMITNYGTYQTHNLRENFKLNLVSIENWKNCLTRHWHHLKYSSLQIYESLYEFCDKNNLDIDTTVNHAKFGYIQQHIMENRRTKNKYNRENYEMWNNSLIILE
jgi:hypothetical protein